MIGAPDVAAKEASGAQSFASKPVPTWIDT